MGAAEERLLVDEIDFVDPAPNIISFEQMMKEDFRLPEPPPRFIKGLKVDKDYFVLRRKISLMLGLPPTTQKDRLIEELNSRYRDPLSFQTVQAFILHLGYCIRTVSPAKSPIQDIFMADESFEP